ncbi:sulfotransferase [Halofilum ochraceum]|uniref:sulfotransferase n=1 Tax=Halofilum ochraceum TaxID=1611323 RepID=UPI000946BEB3
MIKPDLIYVAGAGRSGSTLLDILIGHQEGYCSCGELRRLIPAYLAGELCSCGRRLNECPVWHRVVERWAADSNLDQEGIKRFARMELEYTHPVGARAWYAILGPMRSWSYRWYLDNKRRLLEVLTSDLAGQVIVDSSKSPVNLIHTARALRGGVMVVHLVRHPWAVIESLSRGHDKAHEKGVQRDIPPRSRVRTAVYWLIINWACQVCIRLSRCESRRIRYEHLVDNPTDTIRKLCADARIHGEIRVGHLCAGNRLRMQRTVMVNAGAGLVAGAPDRLAYRLLDRLYRHYGC